MAHLRFKCLFFLLFVIGLPLYAQSDNVVIPESVRVRSGPSESDLYISIGAVFAGENVQPLYRNDDATWILIVYKRQTGWIPHDTVNWSVDVQALPILAPNITPSPPVTPTFVMLTPTESAGQGFVLPGDADRAFVRSGPGRGYESLGQLLSGTLVEPFARNEDTSWILIRYKNVATAFDGFGWVSRNLVQWRSEEYLLTLPVMSADNLTPSATYTASVSPVASITLLAATEVPSNTPTIAPIFTATLSPTNTATWTPLPTTIAPSATFTVLPPTATSALPTTTLLATPLPATIPPSPQLVATATSIEIVAAPTESAITPSVLPISPTTLVASSTPDTVATAIESTQTSAETSSTNADSSRLLIPGMIGAGIAVVGALIYIGMFAQGMNNARLYQDGFVLETCPICQRGHLTMETKQIRSFGIPHVRRTVRCDGCRSVLREKGTHRWLYAVDRLENPRLYERFNGQEVTDEELAQLR